MAKMNWDRVNKENRVRKFGSEPCSDMAYKQPAPTLPATKTTRVKKRGPAVLVSCPICKGSVNQKNLRKHIVKVHNGSTMPKRPMAGASKPILPQGRPIQVDLGNFVTLEELVGQLKSHIGTLLFNMVRSQGVTIACSADPVPQWLVERIRESFLTVHDDRTRGCPLCGSKNTPLEGRSL